MINDSDADPDERRAAAARLKVLEAMVEAIDRRSELYEILDGAADADDACRRLMHGFGFDKGEATSVLDLQLFRLSRSGRDRIAEERDEFRRAFGEHRL